MDSLVNERAIILSNEPVGPHLHLMSLRASHIAACIKPGQFVHMKIPHMDAHILRRPFSIYDVDQQEGVVEVLYQVVGRGTTHMTSLDPGLLVELIGPIGCGWTPSAEVRKALIVAGGVGAAPLLMLTRDLVSRGVAVDVILGAQTHAALVCRDRYESLLGVCPECSTDDGSFGRAGFCTSLVEEAIQKASRAGEQYDYLAVCGPEPLMRIVSRMAYDAGIPAQLSMEKRMACGVGACLSCVVETTEGKKRSCVDGPVFDATKVVW